MMKRMKKLGQKGLMRHGLGALMPRGMARGGRSEADGCDRVHGLVSTESL